MYIGKYLKQCNEVYHTTLNPRSSNVCRIHLVPPKKPSGRAPWAVVVNGYYVLPLQCSWAVLLKLFIGQINRTDRKTYRAKTEKGIIDAAATQAKKIFVTVDKKTLSDDLTEIVETLRDVAEGKTPSSRIGFMTVARYAKNMSAPHRMDLMVASMRKNGVWNCNQKCLHCYAADEPLGEREELPTEAWKKIIDNCRKAHVPSLTFTGGEPTTRPDLPELIDHAKWFVTRLNTNGVLLTEELCAKLYKASLDSVQITLYSDKEEIHNSLVGADRFRETVQGIRNAVNARLDVSVNTPLCDKNEDYLSTVRFCEGLGVRYFSCSGLIPTGNASKNPSSATALSEQRLTDAVRRAYLYAERKGLDVSFTSPGLIDEEDLKKMNMVVPSCGACLSNMAIAPDGSVLPCQSWLAGDELGNMLTDRWDKIFNGKICKKIRKKAVRKEKTCLLRTK